MSTRGSSELIRTSTSMTAPSIPTRVAPCVRFKDASCQGPGVNWGQPLDWQQPLDGVTPAAQKVSADGALRAPLHSERLMLARKCFAVLYTLVSAGVGW